MGLSLYVYSGEIPADLRRSFDSWWNTHIYDSANISFGSFSEVINWLKDNKDIDWFAYTFNSYYVVGIWYIDNQYVSLLYEKLKEIEDEVKEKDEINTVYFTLERLIKAVRIAYENNGWIRAN
jgi:hypothetical protein